MMTVSTAETRPTAGQQHLPSDIIGSMNEGRRRRDELASMTSLTTAAAPQTRGSGARVEGLTPLATGMAAATPVSGAQLKVDELMFKFLSNEGNHALLSRLVDDFEAGLELPGAASHPLASPVLSPRAGQHKAAFSPPRSPRSPASPRSSPMSSPRASPRARSPRAGFSLVSPRTTARGKTGSADPNGPAAGAGISSKSSNSSTSSVGSNSTINEGKTTSALHAAGNGGTAASLANRSQQIPTLQTLRDRPLIDVQDLPAELLSEADRYFDCSESGSITKNDFVSVCKGLCNFPTFLNESLCRRIQEVCPAGTEGRGRLAESKLGESKHPESKGDPADESDDSSGEGRRAGRAQSEDDEVSISKEQFLMFWAREMEPFDEHDRFFRLLKPMGRDYIVSEDLMPHLEELLAYHPGLEFLESTPEFQEKYARTVAARIMFRVNTSRSGRISRREFRLSDLLDVCHQVDEEEDINLVFKYFNYEGFYVCYVKFWELDTDHDFLLSREDLLRHGGHSLVPKIVDRIFDQPVYPFMSGDDQGRMGYEDFVYFFLAEEDKSNEASLRYWFNCVDLDGDGVIRPWEMKAFYDEQLTRLQSYGHEAISFADVLCQAHDFVHPRTEGAFVLADFCKPDVIKISGMMFNILFNLNKFIAFEQRDPHWIRAQHENPDLTDWDRFVAIEYARLASAEEEREIEEESGWSTDAYSSDAASDFGQQSWQYSSESPF